MFPERLKCLRKLRGLTQTEFAKQFNIATGTIAMWETGKRSPDFAMLTKIAEFFDVSTDYLLGKEQKKEPIIEHDRLYDETLDLFKELPTEKKKQALDYLRYLVEHQEKQ